MNREAIEALYAEYCATPSAINEHLPTLRRLAGECESCVEFGVKWGRSTTALLLGCVGDVHSVDLIETPQSAALRGLAGARWRFHVGSSIATGMHRLEFNADLLFVDSLHTYEQVKAELDAHADKVRKLLVFHDVVTFGSIGADGESGRTLPGTLGIMPAILELMQRDPSWRVSEFYANNNGLLVLRRAA